MSDGPFTFTIWDGFEFDIVPLAEVREAGASSGILNGTFRTKAEALDTIIADYEDTRRALAAALARAKRMRRRLSANHHTKGARG